MHRFANSLCPTPGIERPSPHLALRAEVLAGLMRDPPSLPCKLFYDEAGSRLFERITRLPEYYQTRTELSILQSRSAELAETLGPNVALIEYGSGSSTKTRRLLEALDVAAYVPIDISRWSLANAAAKLRADFPRLHVHPVTADYTQPLRLPAELNGRQRVGFFPGGTIGNFTPAEAVAFLARLARTLGRDGRLIIGVDLKKDPAILHAAYNDAAGVTAQFNLNMLRRLNCELGASFDLSAWRHYAFYEPTLGRIQMHLISMRQQVVDVAGRRFAFEEGQGIHTENSYKYTPAEFAALASEGGFDLERAWMDDRRFFGVWLLRLRGVPAR